MKSKQIIQVEGRSLQVSNLDKVLWPKGGFTKADLLAYHVRLAPYTVKHWENRALTIVRYPHGVEGGFFFQKNSPPATPEWVTTSKQGDVEYILPNDLSTITWLVNLGSLEFHPSTYKVINQTSPSYAIIDLDPTPPLGFQECVEVAKYCRELLYNLGLKGYPKLSGATGLHIYIPLCPNYDFELSSRLVYIIGDTLRKVYPRKVTLERLVKNRQGVYLDYLQNHPSKTIVGVYSPRATSDATVSTPLDWEDLDYYCPQDFTIKTVPKWVEEQGDLFAAVVDKPQLLTIGEFFQPIS